MNAREFLEEIHKLKKSVLAFRDIARITGKSGGYLRLFLYRLKQKRLIMEIEKGKYALPGTHPLLVASNAAFPSYISFLSAYSYYSLTTQMPGKALVVSTKSKKSISLGNYRIEFVKFPAKRAFGYKKEDFMGGYIFIAEKEKAVIDSLYLPEYCPIGETMQALGQGMDTAKLVDYALRMDSIVLIKRLGFLLEKNNIDIYEKVRRRINSRYDLLNPMKRKAGEKNKKWKIVVNEVV